MASGPRWKHKATSVQRPLIVARIAVDTPRNRSVRFLSISPVPGIFNSDTTLHVFMRSGSIRSLIKHHARSSSSPIHSPIRPNQIQFLGSLLIRAIQWTFNFSLSYFRFSSKWISFSVSFRVSQNVALIFTLYYWQPLRVELDISLISTTTRWNPFLRCI